MLQAKPDFEQWFKFLPANQGMHGKQKKKKKKNK